MEDYWTECQYYDIEKNIYIYVCQKKNTIYMLWLLRQGVCVVNSQLLYNYSEHLQLYGYLDTCYIPLFNKMCS